MSIESDVQVGFDEYLAETLNNPLFWYQQRIGGLVLPPSITEGGDLVAVRFGFPVHDASIQNFGSRRGWLVASQVGGVHRVDIVSDPSYLAGYRGGTQRREGDHTARRNIGNGIPSISTNRDKSGAAVTVTVPVNSKGNIAYTPILNGDPLTNYEGIGLATEG